MDKFFNLISDHSNELSSCRRDGHFGRLLQNFPDTKFKLDNE